MHGWGVHEAWSIRGGKIVPSSLVRLQLPAPCGLGALARDVPASPSTFPAPPTPARPPHPIMNPTRVTACAPGAAGLHVDMPRTCLPGAVSPPPIVSSLSQHYSVCVQVSAMAAVSLGLMYVGSGNGDVIEAVLQASGPGRSLGNTSIRSTGYILFENSCAGAVSEAVPACKWLCDNVFASRSPPPGLHTHQLKGSLPVCGASACREIALRRASLPCALRPPLATMPLKRVQLLHPSERRP